MLDAFKRYLLDHWRGHQGLAWSFWVNLVLLRALIFLGQELLAPPKDSDYTNHALFVIVFAIIFHGIVFLWQVIGVLRAGEKFIKRTGSQASVWGAQLGLLAIFWLTLSYAWAAWQMTLVNPNDPQFSERMNSERASKYQFNLGPEGKQLSLIGTFEFGISHNLKKLLDENGDIQLVKLNSDGGNIYEARGVANIIRENMLDTHIEASCTSACTLAFIAGKKRIIKNNGKLGFHQYRIEADYMVFADPEEEQERDRKQFELSNVSSFFLDKMFLRKSNEMWFPTNEEMLQAGVIHEYKP